jgi:putative ABC transport system permease protein
MFKNLIKIAVRNLLKSKIFSLINILGLGFGLCCALLISLWVIDEYSIDNYHSKKDRIYKVISELKSTAGSQFWESAPGTLAEVLINEVPGIEQAIRISGNRQQLFKQEHQKLEEWGISADPGIFSVFDFPLIEGDVTTALNDLHSVVISEALAKKLFPNTTALNKTVTIDDWGSPTEYNVTGVMAKIPIQSTFQFEFVISFERYLINRPWNENWGNYNDMTVLLIKKDADVNEISEQIKSITPKYTKPTKVDSEFHLYPFKEIYLRADFSRGIDTEGRIVYVRIFSIIAIIMILIACINFMNLSTARAGKRAKEVGVRKATGASRESLILQFLGESIVIALISGVLAITMADLLTIPFNELTGKSLSILYSSPEFMIAIFVLCILTGILAGIYPALYLSGFNPSKVLKSAVNSGKSLSGFRRVLVILQFSLSITFVVITMIVYSQLQFILSTDLGLEKENILHHDLNGIMSQREAYRNEILQIPGIQTMSSTNTNPYSIGNTTQGVDWQGKMENEEVYFHVLQSDQYFVETFGILLLDGKGFSGTYDSSALQVLINEEAAKVMFSDDPIGSRINVWGSEVEVVGLVKDFHHQSLDKKIDPVIILFQTDEAWRNYISFNGDVNQIIREIEKVYSKFEENYPFSYGFVDEDYAKIYSKVAVMGKLSNIFAFVTIIVSCLGLFGLASYMTEQRKKETGIRKVMGASVFGLVTMFTKNFLGLVLISFVISVPVAWYLSTQWLNEFAFRIDLGLQPFIIGGLSAIIIAIATVSYHTIKVATANPVESLKYE